ncbi:MAG: hypothetical protein US96_C0033G0008 [Candidatus Woesebacteria bacterium GW2011_GWB1_38_5b]|uniref:Uncharacterized protein n=1 Tax=Candidatus Woesebacteria bacterium GW2011_GWB1_38_5b TaxID=1618569 RepID=A0A0G0NBA1_9BACT|nr:MAG: hypothetical protein US96_C0033G0008 [Candidatus Woesebacteria bacterium GW2011_GWB1_38_5b]
MYQKGTIIVLDKSLTWYYYCSMSNIQTTQIKVTLPEELYLHLKSKAEKFGLGLASYMRHLVINDVKDVDIPVFKMSRQREEIALKALEDYRAGKTTSVKNIDSYLADL